jgi:hypothetical protein
MSSMVDWQRESSERNDVAGQEKTTGFSIMADDAMQQMFLTG